MLDRHLLHTLVILLVGPVCLATFAAGCDGDADDDSAGGDDDSATDDDDSAGGDDDSATDDDDTGPPPPPWHAGDVVILAPPHGNNVGLYDLAVCPGIEQVFFTNLHHTNVGVASAVDGFLIDTVDLGPTTGGVVPLFPTIDCLPDGTLLVSDRRNDQLVLIDAAAHQVIGTAPVCDLPGWFVVDDDGDVWLSCETDGTIEQLDGATLTTVRTVDLGGAVATRFHVDGDRVTAVDSAAGELLVLDAGANTILGTLSVPGQPNQTVTAGAGRVYLTVREDGEVAALGGGVQPSELGRIAVGSDPFGVTYVPQHGTAYVVVRQGAEIAEGGTYEGAPGLVVGIDPATDAVISTAAVGKTPHFAVYLESLDRLVVGNEDSLDLSAVGADGATEWTSPPMGLTLDDLVLDAATTTTWTPSHLTDEVVVHDWSTGQTVLVPVAHWPFSIDADPVARRVYVVSQQQAQLTIIDTDSLTVIDTVDLGVGSHNLPCEPLCTGHVIATDVAVDPSTGYVYVSHPPDATVLRLDPDGTLIEQIPIAPAELPSSDDVFQHMAVRAHPSGRVFAYYGIGDSLVAIDGNVVTATAVVDSPLGRPLVTDELRDRVLVGSSIFDLDLTLIDEVEGWWFAGHARGPDVYLAQSSDQIALIQPDTLEVLSTADLDSLAVPPLLANPDTTLPILLVPVEASDLMLVINVMQGTIEVVSIEPDP